MNQNHDIPLIWSLGLDPYGTETRSQKLSLLKTPWGRKNGMGKTPKGKCRREDRSIRLNMAQ